MPPSFPFCSILPPAAVTEQHSLLHLGSSRVFAHQGHPPWTAFLLLQPSSPLITPTLFTESSAACVCAVQQDPEWSETGSGEQKKKKHWNYKDPKREGRKFPRSLVQHLFVFLSNKKESVLVSWGPQGRLAKVPQNVEDGPLLLPSFHSPLPSPTALPQTFLHPALSKLFFLSKSFTFRSWWEQVRGSPSEQQACWTAAVP